MDQYARKTLIYVFHDVDEYSTSEPFAPSRSRLLQAGACSVPAPLKSSNHLFPPVTPVTVYKQVIVTTVHWLKLRNDCRGVRMWPCFSA